MARRKKNTGGPAPAMFRSQVGPEIVEQLLLQFVTLVKQGLHLILRVPSELAATELRQHPDRQYSPAAIPAFVLWVAVEVLELPWPEFCTSVLSQPAWQAVLAVATQADLARLAAERQNWASLPCRQIELAVHDALKEGDKRESRPTGQKPAVQAEYAEFIGAAQVLKLLKKQLRPLLKRLDALDPPQPAHRPRDYRTRAFVLSELLRWMLGLASTEELRRKLKPHPHLAGAVNFTPESIPAACTFSRRRQVVPVDDLKAILHALVAVLIKCRVIEGRAWVVDLTRVPTHASVTKTFVESPNGKSDPEAAFCGYPDNDGGYQFGYGLLWGVDFKTELPFAVVFGAGDAHDSPLALPLLEQACAEHPRLARRCNYLIADGSYATVDFFVFALQRLRAIATVTKNPRNAPDPAADLRTDTYCVLRRDTLAYHAVFNCRTSVERTNSWAKLTFNLKYHKYRGWEAVLRCVLFTAIAMLSVAWVAVKTGHPEKIRSAHTWISL